MRRSTPRSSVVRRGRAAGQVWWPLLAALLGLAGCTPRGFLKPHESLLYRVNLTGARQIDPAALEALYQQKPQTTIPLLGGTPKLWFWVQGTRVYDPAKLQAKLTRIDARYDEKIRLAKGDSLKVSQLFDRREKRRQSLALRRDKGNFLMRKLGEPPVIYDSLKTAKTVDQLNIYLASKGYFRSRVTTATRVSAQKLTLTYAVAEGPESKVVALADSIADPVVAALVRRDRDSLAHLREDGRILREGDRYDADALGRERTRLETLLRNHGYYEFRQQYVTFVADTTNPTAVRLKTVIGNPPGRAHHTLYRLREVTVVTDADRTRFSLKRDTASYGGVRYLAYEPYIRTWALDRKMTVRPQQLYSPDRANLTQRQFNNLDLFRYVSVSFRKAPVPADSVRRDSLTGGVPVRDLDAIVSLAPQRKYQETTELGVGVAAQIPGPFGSERVRVRNVFKGGELLDIGLRGALEGQYPFIQDKNNPNQGVKALQLGGNVGLIFPRVLLTNPRFDRRMARYNPRTRLTANYTYVDRDEYTRSNVEFTYDYVWQRTQRLQYVITPFDISYVAVPRINTAFRDQLERFDSLGFPLKRSFQDQLVPSINLQRIYNSNDFAQTLDAVYSRLLVEVGGLTNLAFRYDRALPVPVYSFAKAALDLRRYWKLGPKTFLVGRFNGGAAKSLEKESSGNFSILSLRGLGVLPYDKYFFAGGPSSVRAWRPRRLGPGSYRQPDQVAEDGTRRPDVIEQPGEILLEGNLEYRTPLFGFFNGALFLDAGNVWTLSDDGRQGARFALNRFYKEFAVGTGVGLRFDFSFLVLRLDIATKIYDPTVGEGYNRWVLGKFDYRNRPAFNLGIGYPF